MPYRERLWALFVTTLERTLIRRCHKVITVSDGIADRLQGRYRLSARPTVVRNTCDPRAYSANGEAIELRKRADMVGGTLVLHLGAVARDRGCATLIRALSALDDSVRLLFLGADDEAFVDELLALAEALGVRERVHVQRSVPISDLLACTAQADVGVSLLEDTCENHRLALPNKVFGYLSAGLPVVASDLPELRHLLSSVPGAVLVDPADAEAVARAIDLAAGGPPRWEVRRCHPSSGGRRTLGAWSTPMPPSGPTDQRQTVGPKAGRGSRQPTRDTERAGASSARGIARIAGI